MVDRWEHHVKIKGNDAMPFISELVIVTSSLPPERVYYNLDTGDSIKQLYRRFEVIHMDEKFEVESGAEVLQGNTRLAAAPELKIVQLD